MILRGTRANLILVANLYIVAQLRWRLSLDTFAEIIIDGFPQFHPFAIRVIVKFPIRFIRQNKQSCPGLWCGYPFDLPAKNCWQTSLRYTFPSLKINLYIHNRDCLVCLLVYFADMHPKNFKKGLEVLFWTKLQQGRVYINQYSTSLNKLVKYRLPMTLP